MHGGKKSTIQNYLKLPNEIDMWSSRVWSRSMKIAVKFDSAGQLVKVQSSLYWVYQLFLLNLIKCSLGIKWNVLSIWSFLEHNIKNLSVHYEFYLVSGGFPNSCDCICKYIWKTTWKDARQYTSCWFSLKVLFIYFKKYLVWGHLKSSVFSLMQKIL